MRSITKWDPLRELDDFQNRLTSFFSTSPTRADAENEWLTAGTWTPLVDITEDEKEYVIKAELPEVEKENVKVSVNRGVLVITGERKFEKEDKGKKYHRVERSYGSFTRSFTLPEDTDASKIAADFKNGVLNVRVAKSEKAKPLQIDVKVA
ncbi:MAG: Hsp20/alpha crystallin family protein [Methylacidiphilales bacterium]|nr:Hsp20/alpha crystallin family protein [Candidatus Methylacidiphilales bacterium]